MTAKKIAPATMPITSSMTMPIDCSTDLAAVSVATPKPCEQRGHGVDGGGEHAAGGVVADVVEHRRAQREARDLLPT